MHLIRHAKAKNRHAWEQPDHLRPLTKRGRREAEAIAARLGEEPLARLVSSPFLRCVQTLEPLSGLLDLPVETTELLAEGADAEPAAELLLSLAASGPLAACTHGDVVFELVGLLSSSGLALTGPAAAPVASTWTLVADSGRFVDARFLDRPLR